MLKIERLEPKYLNIKDLEFGKIYKSHNSDILYFLSKRDREHSEEKIMVCFNGQFSYFDKIEEFEKVIFIEIPSGTTFIVNY